ncbi:MAG: hypothetical protein IPI28_12040 [Candidatus Omnitrophica bacterium]|nr:hypothetical protein [Candidatus Omnitrophota bacterium]
MMTARKYPLEIRIHLIDGSVAAFYEDDADQAKQIIGQIQPDRLFSQPSLLLAGISSVTVIPCTKVNMIEVIQDTYPNWPFMREVTDIIDCSPEAFRSGFLAFRDSLAARVQTPEVGDPFVSWGMMTLSGGQHFYFEARGIIRSVIEQRRLVHQVISAPCLISRRREGGAVLVNPSNIVSLELSPGPRELPNTAWPMENKEAWRTGSSSD